MFCGDALYMFPPAGASQVMAFALAGKGDVIGVDCATVAEVDSIEKQLLALGGRVHCWFFTHAHYDHIEGFAHLVRRGNVRVDKVCYSFVPIDYLRRVEPPIAVPRGEKAYLDFEAAIADCGIQRIRPQKGVPLSAGHFVVTPLSDGEAVGDRLNASSVVYRIDTSGDSVLMLGDMDRSAQDGILREFPALIRCPVVQMAHHGQDGVTEDFYCAVSPRVALWCTPDWLWNNDCGEGYDTGPYKTLETRRWTEKIGTIDYRADKDVLVLK